MPISEPLWHSAHRHGYISAFLRINLGLKTSKLFNQLPINHHFSVTVSVISSSKLLLRIVLHLYTVLSGPTFTKDLRIALDFWSHCLYLPNSRITDIYHYIYICNAGNGTLALVYARQVLSQPSYSLSASSSWLRSCHGEWNGGMFTTLLNGAWRQF